MVSVPSDFEYSVGIMVQNLDFVKVFSLTKQF